MALHAPRTPGTDAYVRIYNSDGSEAGACGNGMRCIAELLFKETGKRALHLRDQGRRAQLLAERDAAGLDRRHGQAALCLERDSARRGIPDTRAIELQIGPIDKPILHSPSAVSMGNPHAIFWVDDVDAYDLGTDRAAAGEPSDVPGARQYFARAGAIARAHRAAHLGARRRPHPGLRLGRLRGGGGGGAPAPHRPHA